MAAKKKNVAQKKPVPKKKAPKKAPPSNSGGGGNVEHPNPQNQEEEASQGWSAVQERDYLEQNPDVKAAIERGEIKSGEAHYAEYGTKENRKLATDDRQKQIDRKVKEGENRKNGGKPAPTGGGARPGGNRGAKGDGKNRGDRGGAGSYQETRGEKAQYEADEVAGEAEAKKLYSDGALGRLTDNIKVDRVGDENLGRLDDEYKLDRMGDDYKLGRVQNDVKLGRLGNQREVSGVSGPGKIDRVGTDSAYDEANITNAKQLRDQAAGGNPHVNAALQRMQSGLGGYNSAENQALRSSSTRELKMRGATDARAMRAAMAEAGVTGQAAAREQGRLRMDTSRNIANQETDILAKNVEEQRLRQGQYGQTALGAQSEGNRASEAALDRLMSARSGAAQYKQTGELANQEASGRDITNKLTSDLANKDLERYNLDAARDADKTNLGQEATEAQYGREKELRNLDQGNQEADVSYQTKKYNTEQQKSEADAARDKALTNLTQGNQEAQYRREGQIFNAGTQLTEQQSARDQAVYNMGQQEKEKAGYIGTKYGRMGLDLARRNQGFQNRLSRRQMRISERGL